MVEYHLASQGAGELLDRDTADKRKWPENGDLDDVYKHCGCTMITKCGIHDDYSTSKFLLTDPLSSKEEIIAYKQNEKTKHRSETLGNYLLFHELLDRYPHYFLRGSAKTGDTFFRHKASRFNYVPPYRVCANELYHKQKQWVIKDGAEETKVRPTSAPPTPQPYDEEKKRSAKTQPKFLPALPPRKHPAANSTATRSFHRNNYFYDMAL